MGHTMAIHSTNEEVILQFGLKKPAFRICVNTPTTLGSIGLTTGLEPAMTLGCGGFGGNITSDNISPRHLLNIKRLAYEIRPVTHTAPAIAATTSAAPPAAAPHLPQPPPRPRQEPVSADVLSRRIDQFLQARGLKPTDGSGPSAAPAAPAAPPAAGDAREPVEFVCEEDVRLAARTGRTILIGERTIITPAAREAGDAQRIFEQAGWKP